MKYHSTRTRGKREDLSFENVLFAPGYADDGGLYVPQIIPLISDSEAKTWKNLNYPDIVKKILSLYISEAELSDSELEGVVECAFQDFDFPKEVVKLQQLETHLYVAELFHGPTRAFKDLSMAILGKLLEVFMNKKKEDTRITILVGTSGDTGPAAAHSLKNLNRVNLIVLYPFKRVSEIQEKQMLTVSATNVVICAVEGNSDELDIPIKECFHDSEFSRENKLGSFNSLQWGRVLLQCCHYIYLYLKCCGTIGDEINIIVPTGAAGNLAAGFLAAKMGFPIKLIASVNENDVLARVFQNGEFTTIPYVAATLAPAMDINTPYNVERLLYFATNSSSCVREAMKEYERNGKVIFSAETLQNLRTVISDVVSVSNSSITRTMQQCFEKYEYIACPHTATGISYYFDTIERSSSSKKVFVCLATASPSKFPEACVAAEISTEIIRDDRITQLKESKKDLPKHIFRKGQDWTSQLKVIIENI